MSGAEFVLQIRPLLQNTNTELRLLIKLAVEGKWEDTASQCIKVNYLSERIDSLCKED